MILYPYPHSTKWFARFENVWFKGIILDATHGVIHLRRQEWNQQHTCLCFGFFEHTTYTLPLRFTTLQPSHITLTDDLTFIPRAVDGTAVARSGETANGKLRM